MSNSALQPWTRKDSIRAAVSLVVASVPVGAMVLEWAVAYLTLGHVPVPSIDDPKFISPLSGVLHSITALAGLAVPAIAVVLPILWLYYRGRSRTGKWVAVGTFLMPLVAVVIFVADPFDYAGWWLD